MKRISPCGINKVLSFDLINDLSGCIYSSISPAESCTEVWWLALSPHSKRVPDSSKTMHVRLVGGSGLSLGVGVSVHG